MNSTPRTISTRGRGRSSCENSIFGSACRFEEEAVRPLNALNEPSRREKTDKHIDSEGGRVL